MGFFDRFISKKGKADSSKPKSKVKPSADEAKKQAFQNVPASQTDAPKDKPVAEKKSADKTAPAASSSKDATWEAYRLLRYPLVTEKTSQTPSQYTFEIPLNANKIDVRNAVYHVYGVQPVSVNIQRYDGKYVRYGRYDGQTRNRKKAIVTLPAGKTIDVFSS